MTMREAEVGGIDEGLGPIEAIPHDELAATEVVIEDAPVVAPVVRHLALGAASETLCGLARLGLHTVHPSKAKRTDCLACRDAYRKKGIPPAPTAKFKIGDRVEYPDGSAWLVEDVRTGGVDVRCVLSGGDAKKGRTSTISADSPLRVFTDEEFAEAVARAAVKDEPAPVDGAPATKPAKTMSTTKWKPTKAEVDKVRELRAAGKAFIPIEQEMGWPEGHGNRPFRIMKGCWNYDTLAEKR